jgi:hypothetical protein
MTIGKMVDGEVEVRSGNNHAARNQSLQNAMYRLGNFADYMLAGGKDDTLAEKIPPPRLLMDSPAADAPIMAARVVIVAILLVVGVRLGQLGDGLSLATAFSLGCIAMLVVSPVARGHYFMLAAPGAIFFPWWFARRQSSRTAAIMAAAPLLLIGLHYCMLPYAGRVGLLGLGLAVWLMIACVLIERSRLLPPEVGWPR